MIVDAHAHVFRPSPDLGRALYPPGSAMPVERLDEEMRRVAVSRAVLVATAPGDTYALTCVARDAERFAAIGVAGAARVELGDALAGLRFDAVPGDADLLSRMEETGTVLCFYGSHDELRRVRPLAERRPRLRIVVNHLGLCASDASVDRLGRPRARDAAPEESLATTLALAVCPNVHVVLSGEYAFSDSPYPYRDLVPRVRALYDAFGADRLMRGSDAPWVLSAPGYGATLRLLEEQLPRLDDRERRSIAAETAIRLFWNPTRSGA